MSDCMLNIFWAEKEDVLQRSKIFPLIWQSFTSSSGFCSTVLTDWNTHLAKPRWPCLGYQSLKTSQCKGAVRTFSLHLHPPQLPWCAVQLYSATFTQVTVLERSVTVFALFSSLSYFVSQGIIYLHSLKIAPGVNPESEFREFYSQTLCGDSAVQTLECPSRSKQKLPWRTLSFISSIQRDIHLTGCHSQTPPQPPRQARGAALRALKFSAKTSTIFWREEGPVSNS